MNSKRIPLYVQILAGMALGIAVGWAFGPKVAPLGELGKVVIQLIKALATPLLFFAIIDAFMRTSIRWRSARWMLAVSIINGLIALGIGLSLSNALKPGEAMRGGRLEALEARAAAKGQAAPKDGKKPEEAKKPEAPKATKIDFAKSFASYVPVSVAKPFAENDIIPLIVLAVLGGMGLRLAKREQIASGEDSYKIVENVARTVYRALEIMIGWVIRLIPIAVFGVVAKTVGEEGFAFFRGLAVYLVVVLGGLALHIAITYQAWIFLFARITLTQFWAGARDAIVYAMGASSSLATLPVTLKCLERMKVSPQSSRLAACVGTNFNNDGILLYEAMAVLFVAQAYGINLTIEQQALAALSCVVAGVGIAGVPEAGFISLSLVLATVGLPLDILPVLLTVDWLLSRARATTNVISDILVANMIDRFSPPEEGEEIAGAEA